MRLYFLTSFIALGLASKLLSEVIHEIVGHGLFVAVFGGRLTSINISATWPYKLSGVTFEQSSGGFSDWELAIVYASGIMACLLISLILQVLLLTKLSRMLHWLPALFLFWISFWTSINAAGYLFIGGIAPFGDISQLINLEVFSKTASLFSGLAAFVICFISLSKILNDLLKKNDIFSQSLWPIAIFWLIIPLITLCYVLGYNASVMYIAISFIPSLGFSGYILLFSRSYEKTS